ncbi:MAG: hypothetical protein MZV63_67945 [Marinilabiliales bacterium]|nr:hypothetical protein [Marinilabiliales bacterium]
MLSLVSSRRLVRKRAITSDLVYMNLNQEVTPGTIVNSGDVTAKQLIWEAAGLYRITPFLEAGVGGRLNYLEIGIDVQRKDYSVRD